MNKILRTGLLFTLLSFAWEAQSQTANDNIPYSFPLYQKLNKEVYDVNSKKLHSSIRSYYADDTVLTGRYQEILSYGVDSLRKRSWVRRKITEEHLFNFVSPDYTIYADFLPDFQIGKDFNDQKNTWKNTRGYQIGGTIGKKFSFYTNGYENQGVFADYLTQFINTHEVVPSEMSGKIDYTKKTKDWAYVTALLSYSPNKVLNLALGYDKNFIGDGYRSMLLSDVAANYSFVRLRAAVGDVQYQTIFSYMLDNGAPLLTTDRRLGSRGKWNAMHYLDWNVTNRLSLGFFQAVTWADAEPGYKRGFDYKYIQPLIFLGPVFNKDYTGSDNMRIGFNGKYEVFDKTVVYGQLMVEDLSVKEFFKGSGFWANKTAVQIGFKGSDLFEVTNLSYLAEYNAAKPYAYSHSQRLTNYAGMRQSLAHPLGGNFREFVGLLNYNYKRFDFQGQALYARYGLDPAGENYGKDIFSSYDTRVMDYGNKIGQGIGTDLYFAEVKASYLLNPKFNLRLELGGVFRQEQNSIQTSNTSLITFGLRSTFRNLYQDF